MESSPVTYDRNILLGVLAVYAALGVGLMFEGEEGNTMNVIAWVLLVMSLAAAYRVYYNGRSIVENVVESE